ncbi:MAG: P-loop NTPase [Oscillospiraceae bacterium]|nr:P-loop NTPase [Oscillospiraceae bacterium]
MSVFAVTSGKGGAGKSCVCAYTAAALAKMGQNVLLVESGFGYRTADLIFGVHNEVLFDVSDVLEGRCNRQKAIVTLPQGNLSLLMGPPMPHPYISAGRGTLEALLWQCAEEYDTVIVDGADFAHVSPGLFDTVMLVVTPDTMSVRAGGVQRSMIDAKDTGKLRLVINNAPARIMPMLDIRDFDDIIDTVGARLIGVVPHSPNLQYSSNNAVPIEEGSLTLDVFDNIAARLLGQHRKLLIR